MPADRAGHTTTMVWSDNDCRAALRAAATAHAPCPLRIVDYRAWRAEQIAEWPPDLTIVRRLGPWTQAVRAAGGATVYFTDADCIDALQAAAADLRVTELRMVDYQDWTADHPGRPEQQAIVAHLGRWPLALDAAGLTPVRVTRDLEAQLS